MNLLQAPLWGPKRLNKKLLSYGSDLQIRLETNNGIILQGPISYWSIPDLEKRHIKIRCPYLCDCRVRFSVGPGRIERWFLSCSDEYEFEFNYIFYEPQRMRDGIKGKEDRPERVRIHLRNSEQCWVFQKGDPQCLVVVDGRYYTESMSPDRFSYLKPKE